MKKLTYLTLLCAVVIVGLLAPPVAAAEIAPGDLVPFAVFPGSQENPDVDGDMVVWEDGRNGNKEIYFSNSPGTSGTRITNDPASQEKPSISGDYIAWQDYRNGNWDIYLYKRSTGETTQLTNDTGKQWLPIVRGNYVAWYDSSSGDTNVVLYDIAAGSKDIIECDAKTTIPGGSTEFKPALSEKYVAWIEEIDERIRYYSIEDGEIKGPVSTSTAAQSWPSLYGSVVAWEDNRHASPDIYMTNLDNPSGGEQRITSDGSDQVSPALTGQILAWEDKRDPPRSIYMYDRNNGEEMAVPTAGGEQLYPAASGNMIVWQKARGSYSDLYAFIYDPEGEPGEVTRIEVEPPTATLDIGDEVKFNATCYDENNDAMPDLKVSWSCSNGTVGYIDSGGYFLAYEVGTATVTATAGGIPGTATVTVNAGEPAGPVATEVAITPLTPTVTVNNTVAFAATVRDQFDRAMTGVNVTWASSNETIGTIDNSTGLFTALAEGTTTVTATAGSVSGTATVTVTAEEPVAKNITVTPTAPALAIDATEQFEAIVRDQFGNAMTGIAVNWSCSNTTVGTIDNSTGLFTALAAGTATVTATAGSVTGTATVTVNAEDPVGPEEPVLTRIALTPPGATLDIEDVQRFMVTGYDQNGNVMPAGEIEWACNDGAVGTIDGDGFFTALTVGTATITATAGSCSAEVTVTVNAEESALAKIVFFPSAVTLYPGDSLQFEAVGLNCYGNIVPDAAIVWTSSNETIGTIDEGGLFTAICAGTTTLTASGDGATGTTTVTVSCDEPVLTSIVVTPSAITLANDETATFTATALDQFGCEMSENVIDWECGDPCVGTIDLCSGVFLAEDCGTTTVTATAGGITGTADVEVTSCSGVGISPSAIVLDPGDEWPFTVYGLQDNAGSTVDWSCSDPGVGEITADGCFTAICEGTASVTAMIDGVDEVGPATVMVRSVCPVPARIVVSPSDFTIASANGLQLTETVYDQYGCEMPEAVVVWESSDPNIGAVGGCGLFAAGEEGEVTITASMDGVSGSACVTVAPRLPFPARVEIDPSEATLAPGETRVFTATVFDPSDNEMGWVKIKWSCLDDDVGTIDRSGLFSGVSQGSTEITARAGSVERTASVTVTAASTPDPTPDPTQTPTNPGSNSRAYSDGGGDPGPSFFAGICEDLKSGETHTFSGIDVTSVGSIAITAADNIPRLLMTVKETGCPNPAEPPGSTYKYVEITLSWVNPNQIGGATLTFTLPAKWLDEHGMAPEDVRLMRYVNGGWQILETEVVDEENGKYTFRATTPGFSTFAIAAAPSSLAASAEEIDVTPEVTETPGETEEVTTEPTEAIPTTTPAAPLVYAPFLAPLAFLLWGRRKN
ncbi:PGF-pre-PGF domain-containing protein [Methanoculleus sp. Afa-1]|uniref:PGF-pre-PGF domain-containing protein n=1 Tax=Methanoculleus formosensis TaxID=2590886 RepID=A0A9E5DFS2_9EURY|nr:Ig-like domain-containing protein [Methanoculleus sp. Afa-1]MCT8337481.1 PGF-pre-PGF domain-containing protein [Methanoculleus sp. Afa-1]